MSQLQILLALSLVQALPSVALARLSQFLHIIDDLLSVSSSCFRSQFFSFLRLFSLNSSDVVADADYGLGVFIDIVEDAGLHLEEVVAFAFLLIVLLLVVSHV